MSDFVAFRTLYTSIPMTEQVAQLICDCLNYYLKKSKVPVERLEKIMALYKVKQ
jgi:hypothetical protein